MDLLPLHKEKKWIHTSIPHLSLYTSKPPPQLSLPDLIGIKHNENNFEDVGGQLLVFSTLIFLLTREEQRAKWNVQ